MSAWLLVSEKGATHVERKELQQPCGAGLEVDCACTRMCLCAHRATRGNTGVGGYAGGMHAFSNYVTEMDRWQTAHLALDLGFQVQFST